MKKIIKKDEYTRRLGARLLSEANDLKRTPAALADELGWDLDKVKKIIAGEAGPELAQKFLFQMVDYYPISLRDLWVERDDTNHGTMVMTGDESKATARTFERLNSAGALSPYYEYRDTAMSKLAPYRPEWIRELRQVHNSDPSNPDIAFNNGHMLHQLTFFVGEVNFYWIVNGKKYGREMNTGDSALITPFVPHSFTTRSLDPERQGLIIAVTYRGSVNQAADDISRLDFNDMNTLSGNLRNTASVLSARIGRYCQAESLTNLGLARRLEQQGMSRDRAKILATVSALPSPKEISLLAVALNVKDSDLWVSPMCIEEEVTITQNSNRQQRAFPDTSAPLCLLFELARSKHQPSQRSFDVHMTGNTKNKSTSGFKHHLHEYLFNYGDNPVQLLMGSGKKADIPSGGSAYICPAMEHWLQGPEDAKLLMVRVAGGLTEEALNEFSSFAEAGKERALMESKRWF